MGGFLIGLAALAVAVVLLTRPSHVQAPAAPRAADTEVAPTPTNEPAPLRVSRSRGQDDWMFFFRAGDTLSRMVEGSPLGVVVRTEKRHVFPDGSTGPAYVVRGADQREGVFDADELERSARVESIRDVQVPIAPASKPTR